MTLAGALFLCALFGSPLLLHRVWLLKLTGGAAAFWLYILGIAAYLNVGFYGISGVLYTPKFFAMMMWGYLRAAFEGGDALVERVLSLYYGAGFIGYCTGWYYYGGEEIARWKALLADPFASVREWRERRSAASEEAMFYHQYQGPAAPGGMTVNVRTPIQWSEWLAIAYWVMKMALLAIPAVLILSSTGTLLTMAAALVPVEWQDEVIRGLEALQDLVRKASPQ